MSLLQTLALSSSFAKIPLAGLGAATGGGLVTYLLIVPKDNREYYVKQKEELNSQLQKTESEYKTKLAEDMKIFLQIGEVERQNSIHKRVQDCNKEKIDSYRAGKEYASNLLSDCR